MKLLFPYLRIIVFLAILAGAIIYLTSRISIFFNITNKTPFYIGFSILTVYMIGGLIAFSNMTSIVGNIMYIFAASLLGFVLYFLLTLFVIDLVRIFLKINPLYYGIVALSLATIITISGIINAFIIRDKELPVPINGLTEDVSIMHWSDVHLGHFRGKKFLQKIVARTNDSAADMLVITGDLFDGRIRLSSSTLEPLQDLNMPVYFVEGNHDKYTGVKEVKSLLIEIGVRVIENEVLKTRNIQLVGLNHMLADNNSIDMMGTGNNTSMKEVLKNLEIDPGMPAVLLHHSPDGMEYANKAGIDLFLSGHTHGGQEFPVTILNHYLFPYNRGLYEYNGTKIFVSMGVGTFGPPIRIGTHGELVKITLSSN